MSSSFDRAFSHAIQVEGAFSNNPKDRGGPTMYGITQRTLSEFRGYQVGVNEVRDLSLGEAKRIYKKFYWDIMKLEDLEPRIAICLFDQGINRGPKTAIMSLQRALGITADGDIGPITRAKLLEYPTKVIVSKFVQESVRSYISIVKQDYTQIEFLTGWCSRVFKLMDAFLEP